MPRRIPFLTTDAQGQRASGQKERGTAMENSNYDIIKILFIIGIALYVISPVDAIPGPIDDIILLMYLFSNK